MLSSNDESTKKSSRKIENILTWMRMKTPDTKFYGHTKWTITGSEPFAGPRRASWGAGLILTDRLREALAPHSGHRCEDWSLAPLNSYESTVSMHKPIAYFEYRFCSFHQILKRICDPLGKGGYLNQVTISWVGWLSQSPALRPICASLQRLWPSWGSSSAIVQNPICTALMASSH